MRLIELIDRDYGLRQDDWSKQGVTCGNKGQLTVIGYSGRTNSGSHKKYLVRCSICCQDEELFGDGVFADTKYHLLSGRTPCGCSRITFWTEDQYKILCRRACDSLGNTFIGWEGEFKGCAKTKVIQECKNHGVWNTGTINNLTSKNSNRGCPRCRIVLLNEGSIKSSTKEDSSHIKDFMDTGKFPKGTTFTRMWDLPDTYGRITNWKVGCPVCNTSVVSNVSNLKRGNIGCDCNKRDSKTAYVNIIEDNGVPVALKFGITSNINSRIYSQSRCSAYFIYNLRTFNFPNSQSCREAERACKKMFVCGILPKDEFPDGYTETTYLYNLDAIIQVFELHGGCDDEV